MKDIFARAASDPRGCPATVTSPSSARYTPASTLMRVDFPPPLGPRRASTLPRWRSRLTPSSATVPPNRLPRPDTRTSGSPPEREGGPLVEVSEGSWASCMDVSGADLGSPVREGGTGMMLRAVQGHSVYDGSYAASRANLTQMALPWGCGGYLMHRPAVRRGTGHGPVRGGAPRWCSGATAVADRRSARGRGSGAPASVRCRGGPRCELAQQRLRFPRRGSSVATGKPIALVRAF